MPASHRAASCTANVPFPLRPRTFPPLQCPPLPGPTRPLAPLCERSLLPDLASSSVLSPTQKICRGDPKKHFFWGGVWFGLFVYSCPSHYCHLGSSYLERTEVRWEWDWKQISQKKLNPLSPSEPFKTEPMLQNMSGLWKSTQGHLKQCDKWAKRAPHEAPNVIVYTGVKVKQWGGMVACW